jgi:predicted nuclease of predicted toxin-antitoxin system
MRGFLVDEDLPRSLAASLREHGHQAVDVRDVGLRGCADIDVFEYARRHGLTLITADLGFANEVVFPPADHFGVVLGRFPNSTPAPMLVLHVTQGLEAMAGEDLQSCIVVVEPGQIRVRRVGRPPS